MNKPMPLFIQLLSLASLVLLAACNQMIGPPGDVLSSTPATGTAVLSTVVPTTSAGTARATSQPLGTNTPSAQTGSQPTAIVITALPATSQPLSANTPMAQPGSEASATPGAVSTAPAGQELSVTLADDSKTIHLKVGQRFLLDLGEDYNWNPIVADQTIVSRVVGILVIRGAQGIYETDAPGTTTLMATGDPACRQSKPACAMPSRLFKVTIVVGP